MKKMEWSERLSVGHQKLDQQHRKIIKIINKLVETPDVSVHSEMVHDILYEMLLYSKEHLEYEENLLKENDYPDLKNHAAKHLDYIEKLSEYSLQAVDGDNTIPIKITSFLKTWWENHILKEDMKFRSFLHDKGLSGD